MTPDAVVVQTPLPETPYRGIESFRYIDQPIFFARNEETRKLLRYVAVYRGVLFYGDSGSGKSSLINAGFIPEIIEDGFTPNRLRVQPVPDQEIIIERISTRSDGKPPFLPSSFVTDDDTKTRVVMSAAEMKKRLQELPRMARPLLIFDQFEEFSTLFEEAPRGLAVQQAQEAQKAILDVLLELLRDSSLPVKLLFVFREDYLAKLAKLFALRPDLSDQYLRLTPPTTDALHEIIRGSFEKFPGHFNRELSEDLTQQLAKAIAERSETSRLNLSEVQIACLKLWQSSNPDALFKEKGVQGLLEDYLSDSLNRLGDLRGTAVALLSRMVTSSGTRNIISEYDLITQVHEDEQIPEERLKAALQSLVQDTKLVRRERRYNTYFYDIVSEFLVPWITRQKNERHAEAERRKLAATERLKRRRAYRVAALICLLVALTVGAVTWIILTKRTTKAIADGKVQEAEKKQKDAERAAQEAAAAKAAAEEQKLNAERAAITALAAKQQSDDANTELTTRLNKELDTNKTLLGKVSDLQQKVTEATNDANNLRSSVEKVTKERDQARGLIDDLQIKYRELMRDCAIKRSEGKKGE